MNGSPLTTFQINAESAISSLLRERGKSVAKREVYEGMVPFYSTALQRYVKLTVDGLEVWLFDNEASFSGPLGRGEFERQDYESEGELLQALLRQLTGCL